MNWEAIGAVGELVGAVAVLVTLLYLALQIRHSNRIAIGNTEIQLRERAAQINRSIMEYPDDSKFLPNLFTESDGLPQEEIAKLRSMARQATNLWASAERALQNDLITESEFQIYFVDIEICFNEYPGLTPHFAYLRDLYLNPEAIKSSRVWTEFDRQLKSREH